MRHFATIACLLVAVPLGAQEKSDVSAQPVPAQELFDDFAKMMEKTVMTGTFTVDGDAEQNRRPERYEISKVRKQEQGDYWSFFARIAYGDHDVTLPIPVEIKWAGKTPVITVDELTIPGMGTFDARVLISDNKYAGTWRHGKVGGLMFGTIKKQDVDKSDATEVDQEGDDSTP